ncbi:MAG: endonuclease/exonuclease/phosphatase family protein [Clostridia bacterium]|nr:endonuclease/exonuclease/phosphatase family protein [Clostridia bacterium]
MKKLVFLLICILTFMSLVSCGGDDTTTTEPQNTNEITVEELAGYDIIRPSGAANNIFSLGNSIRTAIKEKYGYNLTYRSDVIRENIDSYKVKELEILIGKTNREETTEFLSSIRYKDYGYGVVNNKIVIAGHTEEGTTLALQKFIDEVINAEPTPTTVFFDGKTSIVEAEYERSGLKIGDLSAKNMVIVYPTALDRNEIKYAKDLALLLSEKSGYSVEAFVEHNYTYREGDEVILIGNTVNKYGIEVPADLSTHEMYISVSNKAMIVTGGGYYSFDRAAKGLIESIEALEGEVLADPSMRKSLATDSLSVMSFNVWGWNRSSDRDKRVVKMLYEYMPDTFGLQEDLPGWIKMLEKELPFYGHIGIPVNGSEGASCSVFYLKEKFEVVDYGTKWLSATPDVASKYDESTENRIVTYVTFRCKDTGETFTHMNTHLEHTSNTAREKQADVMLSVAENIEGALIMTGDFNSTKSSGPINKYIAAGYEDASAIADEAQTGGTFHGGDGSAGDYVIDYIFVNECIDVLKYKVCTEKIDGGYVSDHHPIYAEYKLKKSE